MIGSESVYAAHEHWEILVVQALQKWVVCVANECQQHAQWTAEHRRCFYSFAASERRFLIITAENSSKAQEPTPPPADE